jgi:predicted metal-dependent peptidase
MADILDEITKTTIQLMLDEPFYGHLLSNFNKQVSNLTESIELYLSENKNITIIVNEEYWNDELSLSKSNGKNLREGAIKHQLLHLVFKHITRIKEFKNFKIFSIASDLVVNQYISPNQLTADTITFDLFPQFKFSLNQTLDYYYNKLHEEYDKMSDADNKLSEENLNESQKNLIRLLNDSKNKALNQHLKWKDLQNLNNSDLTYIENQLNNLIQNSYSREKVKNGFGNLPYGIQVQINNILNVLKPSVNWKRVLRLFANSSSRTRIKNTIKKPSKRYGTSPGIKIKNHNKLLVALDTSGSVNEEELRSFFGELFHIRKQGAEIFIVECDTDIHDSYYYSGKMPDLISGRGGTCFDKPIQYANEVYFPDALIYFTDGYADEPAIECRVPILWMISANGLDEESWDYLPGRKVKMNKI